MRETLDELTKVAAALNRESDELNAVIEDFEEQLESAGVGVSVWLNENYALDESDWDEDYDPDRDTSWRSAHAKLLGYTKIDGKWRIAVKDVTLRKGDARARSGSEEVEILVGRQPITPLAQASRAVRVEAAAHFETLAKVLTMQMKRHLDSIAKARKLVKE